MNLPIKTQDQNTCRRQSIKLEKNIKATTGSLIHKPMSSMLLHELNAVHTGKPYNAWQLNTLTQLPV